MLVDWEIIGGDRSHADVAVTVATRAEVSELLNLLREAGCEPRTLEAEGLVLSHLANLFDLPGTQLLIDLGHLKTTCCLISEGRPVAAYVDESRSYARTVCTRARVRSQGRLATRGPGGHGARRPAGAGRSGVRQLIDFEELSPRRAGVELPFSVG